MTLEVGRAAPDIVLPDQHGQTVRLADFRGRQNVLLVFFPYAFSSACANELTELQERHERFAGDLEAQVLGVSCDSKFALRVFADREGVTFPLLSDFWPHGEVARAYGVLDERSGAARRGTFVIDRGGMVRWAVVNEIPDTRDVADYEQALASL